MASSSYVDQISDAPLLEFHHFSSCTGRKSRPSCSCSSCWRCRLKGFFLSIRALASSSCKAVWHGAALKDPSKTIHALKMALALVLAFMLVLLQALYEQLDGHAIWAIITVVVVFEFTTGATVSKGLNRGAGTLLAGLLAVAVGELASMSGEIGQPILIELSVFIIGGFVTFVKLWPSMKSYEYGFRTFLITFSIITVAEYQGDRPLTTALKRFLVILLGAAIGIVVNVFVLPCWAGEDLHRCIVNNFYGVADSLEVCVNEYLRGTTLEIVPSKMFQGLAADDPVYKGYQSTLISASKEESLAGFAKWEPPHGRFKMIKYPWHLYVKVGALLRHCAYSIVALHSCLWSAIQVSQHTSGFLIVLFSRFLPIRAFSYLFCFAWRH